jgi:hypothetical protein
MPYNKYVYVDYSQELDLETAAVFTSGLLCLFHVAVLLLTATCPKVQKTRCAIEIFYAKK